MKKLVTIIAALLALAMVLAPAGCGGDDDKETPTPLPTATIAGATITPASETPTPAYTGGKHTFKIAHGNGISTVTHKIWELADERLRHYTDGQVKLEIFPANSLYGNFEMWDALATGALDIGNILDYQVQMAGFEDFQIGWLQLFWGATPEEAMEHGRRFWNHPEGGQKIFSQTEPTGVKIVAIIPNSALQLFAGSFELKSLHDLKDKKCTSVGGITSIPIEYGGAKQVFVDTAEWQIAIEQGLVDCIVSAPEGAYSTKLYEVAGHGLLIDLITVNMFWSINLDLWNSLSTELQDIIQNKVIPEMLEFAEEEFPAAEQEGIRKLEEVGMVLSSISQEERIKARDDMWEITVNRGFLDNMDQDLIKLADHLRDEPYDTGYFYP